MLEQEKEGNIMKVLALDPGEKVYPPIKDLKRGRSPQTICDWYHLEMSSYFKEKKGVQGLFSFRRGNMFGIITTKNGVSMLKVFIDNSLEYVQMCSYDLSRAIKVMLEPVLVDLEERGLLDGQK